ncbi:MAG: aspartyl/asparaginyl beta-hydroxylase domain-containing protein [Gammaproteobacteria bacterium]|nr:aspartyl/asparaginyl beta-hydroxylase domain-containing protein [Gammaproteobacteria bacterium]
MRLPQRFFRLPVRFDVQRLRDEVEALPREAWTPHPNGEPGNSAVRLITVNGGDNDQLNGPMRMTGHLERSPYIRQVLASFGVVWSRSRLLRLAPGAKVAVHSDIHHHWFSRVRMHVPITTLPEVRFTCEGESVHMAAGESWIFDNWRLHAVQNPTTSERVHLVADTSGSAAFWELAARGQQPGVSLEYRAYDPERAATPLTEQTLPRPVMSPAEMELLVLDMRGELVAEADTPELRTRLSHYHALLLGLVRDWRQLYQLHGEEAGGREEFARVRDTARERSKAISAGLIMRTNRSAAHRVLEARVLQDALLPADRATTRQA